MDYPPLSGLYSSMINCPWFRGPFLRAKWFRAGLPVLLAALFSAWNFHYSGQAGFNLDLQRFTHGGFFLAGVPGIALTSNMPLFEIVVALSRQFGATLWQFFLALHLGVYALVFLAGCLLNGYWTGIVSLAVSGLIGVEYSIIYEQTFYSLSLLLVLISLLIKSRENTVKNSLLCGLAVGVSLLIRTPLFLFPPLAVVCDWYFSRERSRAFMLRSLVFLSSSYALLLPWGFLNHSLSGRFTVLDTNRSACPTITAAVGSIFTMEGDCRKLAGLGPEDSAVGFYLREWGRTPLFHLLTVFRRLWVIFLFYPLSFVFFLAALAFGRWRDKPLAIVLPLYFILIHALLSVETPYFYPMRYLLVPLIAGGFMSRFGSGTGASASAAKAAAAALWLAFSIVLGTEALITAYPFRVARAAADDNIYALASSRFPRDGMLHGLKCRKLWSKGDDAGFRGCLNDRTGDPDEITGCYFAAVYVSSSPSEIPLPTADEGDKSFLQSLIVRMLREVELGQRASAAVTLREARRVFELHHNRVNALYVNGNSGAAYELDRQLDAKIRLDTDRFWDPYVYQLLFFWPPREMAVILSRLGERAPLPGRLKVLSDELAQGSARGKTGDIALRSRIFSWAAPYPGRTKTENALAARSPSAGSQQELLDLCRALAKQKETEKALEVCQQAVYSISDVENAAPVSSRLTCDASFESYKLLKALGRGEEAREMLLWTVKNAPRDWPGQTEARKESAR